MTGIPHSYLFPYKDFAEVGPKLVEEQHFQNPNIRHLQRAPNDPKLTSTKLTGKVPLYIQ